MQYLVECHGGGPLKGKVGMLEGFGILENLWNVCCFVLGRLGVCFANAARSDKVNTIGET